MPANRSMSALALAAALLLAAVPAARFARGEDVLTPAEIAKRESIERLDKSLRGLATSPRAEQKKDEILKVIDSLSALGGVPAARAALSALVFDDEAVEKAVMKVVEENHAKSLIVPLALMIDDKDFRRRFRLHALLAHAFEVIADPAVLEPLTELVKSEDPHVVAAAADAAATLKTASHAKRWEPVRRMVDLFESTYNMKESIHPEDRVPRDRAKNDWEIYGASLKRALQALTGQTNLVRPKQFRDWWNDHKHDANW